MVCLDPEAPPCGGRVLERETNRETNGEPRLSIRNKAGGGTRSQAGGHMDRCSLVGGRPDPDPARAPVTPVLINRFPSREIRKKKKKKPQLSSLLCHNLSVPNFGNAPPFLESIIQSCALHAPKVSNAQALSVRHFYAPQTAREKPSATLDSGVSQPVTRTS